jgi:nucleotide-binding universal stress UspA family protein
MRYQHILAATDFSDLGDLAVESAVELAIANKARLTLVYVLPELPTPSPLVAHYYDARHDVDRLKGALASAEQGLRARIPAKARETGLAVDVDVRHGDPASEILAAEAHHRPSLIVIATHGRTGISRWIMGSVAERVMGHAKADVLAVRARGEQGNA